MVALGQRLAQFGQAPPGVRVAVQEHVHGLPEQPHQQVAAPGGTEAQADQVDGQRPAQRAVFRAEQAVVREAERLGERHRVADGARLVEYREDGARVAGTVAVLAGDPGAQPQPGRRRRVDERQRPAQPLVQQRGTGDGAVLVHPQAAHADRGHGHRLGVAEPLRLPVGRVELTATLVQVAVARQRVGTVGQQRPEVVDGPGVSHNRKLARRNAGRS